MKKETTWLLAAGFFLCAAMPAAAQDRPADEMELESAAAELDADAAEPGGEKAVVDKLMSEFKVDGPRVQGLREQGLGYGEVAVALTLAQGLPGGITDVNVHNVTRLRLGPPALGWGKVSKELGLKPGAAISKVKKVQAEVRERTKIEKARLGKAAIEKEKNGKKARGGK